MIYTGQHTALERFLRYVQIDTESDPNGTETPTTQKQFDLAHVLAEELKAMGASDVEVDAHCYVMATLPSNIDHEVPTICFCSHMDTTPDVTGKNVKPQVHKNYQGGAIVIEPSSGLNINEVDQPYLKEHYGHSIVTASGDTLLGADDKAGVAAIMDAANYLLQHPEVKHGKIRVLFTPDEEVGRGVDKLDMKKLDATFGYTLDGGEAGYVEGETFSADGCKVTVTGISAHPGYAKGKLVNALRVASHLVSLLPQDASCPEATEGREGFVHLVTMEGSAEEVTLNFIIRDFETAKLDGQYEVLLSACAKTLEAFPKATIATDRSEQYRNLGEILKLHPEVMANAEEAVRRIGIPVKTSQIRGGTDGSRLSFMGLPCPNLFTGMQMIHSRKEWISERDLNLAAANVVELANVWGEK
ncbi:MAG: peptidase T [Saprospiraceae bacterium]